MTPLEKLMALPPEQLDREDFLAAKSGRDDVSKLKKENILTMLAQGEWEEIVDSFDKEKYRLSAARWRRRGLPLETAIRKVQIDREVGHEIAEKRPRYDWREGTSDEDYED